MHYNIALGAEKYLYFYFKKILQCRDGDGTGISEPVEDGNGVRFLIPAGYGRVTGKYMRVGYGDGEDKTRPQPAPLSCLLVSLMTLMH